MKNRYGRAFSLESLEALKPGGILRFLISDLPKDDPYAIDIQLRENNSLYYYHGTTSLLMIRLKIVDGIIKINVTANKKAYEKCPEYGYLMKIWDQAEHDDLRKLFSAYLVSAIRIANSKCYKKRNEGYWQNRLSIDWGPRAQSNDKYIIIDRECVLRTSGDRNIDKSHYKRYEEILARLQKSEPRDFGEYRNKALGDELDMLALDEESNLVAIELKHVSNLSGIYWGPLQVLAYRDAFNASPDIAQSLKELVNQKIDLGLLPSIARARLPQETFSAVRAVLIIAEHRKRSGWEERINRVISEAEAKATSTLNDINNILIITLD